VIPGRSQTNSAAVKELVTTVRRCTCPRNPRAISATELDARLADVEARYFDSDPPLPPFWGRRIVTDIPVSQLFPYINPDSLFGGQWGLKKRGMSEADYQKLLEEKAYPAFEALQRQAVEDGLLDPKVAYGYFPVQAQGNDVIIYHVEEFLGCTCHPDGPGRLQPTGTPREWMRFSFPRQEARRRLCVSDFFRSAESNQFDVLGIQLVTVGDRATEKTLACGVLKDRKLFHPVATVKS